MKAKIFSFLRNVTSGWWKTESTENNKEDAQIYYTTHKCKTQYRHVHHKNDYIEGI